MDKHCGNCKHTDVLPGKMPCVDCEGEENPTHWEPATVDMVNRPPHYTHGQYECINVMIDNFGKEAVKHFCLLNAFKYVWRSDYKNGVEDVKKAMWYLDKWLELEGEKHDN